MSSLKNLSKLEKLEYGFIQLLAFFPVTVVSALGAFLGVQYARKAIKAKREWVHRIHRSLQHLEGIHDIQLREQKIMAYGQQVGRLYTEYLVQSKIIRQGHLDVVGNDYLTGNNKPIIYVAGHMANWELMVNVLAQTAVGDELAVLYEVRETPVRMLIATEARKRLTDPTQYQNMQQKMTFVVADKQAMRHISRAMQRGANLLIFIDEEKAGHVLSPALGRNMPYAGNRWMASKLATKYNADVIPVNTERVGDTHFRLTIEPALAQLTECDDKVQRLQFLANQMDAAVERWVRKCPEHWYFLPHLDLDKTP